MSKSQVLRGESVVIHSSAVVDVVSAVAHMGVHSRSLSFTLVQSVFDGVVVSEGESFVYFWANKGDAFQSSYSITNFEPSDSLNFDMPVNF